MTGGAIDLHVHTRASDGTLSPCATVSEAKRRGVGLLSITDHDITEGIPEAEAAAAELGVTLVPGVEVSLDVDQHEVHVLGYFIEPGNPRLEAALRQVRHGRESRNEEMLERLAGPISRPRWWKPATSAPLRRRSTDIWRGGSRATSGGHASSPGRRLRPFARPAACRCWPIPRRSGRGP